LGGPDSDRRYPSRPIVGVGAVVVLDRRIVLARRRFEPLAGQWSLPGGGLELGETIRHGLVREVREETGLEIEPGPLLEIFEPVLRDEHQRVRHHYVILDYLARAVAGTPTAGSDVDRIALADPDDLHDYQLTDAATRVVTVGVHAARERGWW
jgi:8-oxo-dGTP diphosphatase